MASRLTSGRQWEANLSWVTHPMDFEGAIGVGWDVLIIYVDESGDLGTEGSPTRHFVMSAVVFQHSAWARVNADIARLRSRLFQLHGLDEKAEIHAREFLGGARLHRGLDIRRRFQCVHHIIGFLKENTDLMAARVAVKKGGVGGGILLGSAWDGLIEEISAVLPEDGIPPCGATGWVVVVDHHGAAPYRPENWRGNDLSPEYQMLDLPFGRRASDSPILQIADLLGFLTKQALEPGRHFMGSAGKKLVARAEKIHVGPCRVITK